jgi:RNA recognition motif-containing protein
MKEKSTNKDLYITDISFEVEEEDLQKLFSICGTVKTIYMMTDQKSGLFKGTAFVHMATAAEAREALMLDGTRLIDRCISVRAALPKKPSAPAVETVVEKPKRTRRPRHRRK